jgi:predicted hydrocarbon binding protein
MRDWLSIIGNIERPVLGEDIPILIFRAFRVYSGEYLKDLMGEKGAVVLFQNAGRELGKELGGKLRDDDLERYLENVRSFVKDSKVGLLAVEELNQKKAVLRLDECITCAGMPNIGARICHFEVGFVAGIFENFLGKKVRASETKCNAMGEGTCEVTVDID